MKKAEKKRAERMVLCRLPSRIIEPLDVIASEAVWPRRRLIETILRDWLAGPRLVAMLPPPVAKVAPHVRENARRRLRIVKLWKSAMRGVRLGDKEKVTRDFLVRLERSQGIKLSIRTLYYWIRRSQAGGEDGLIDGRQTRDV